MVTKTYCFLTEKPSKANFSENFNLDDELFFVDEEAEEITKENWKVLIVDDEPQVHTATNIALKKFDFQGKTLNLISAYSAQEAKQLIQIHSDIAIVLLDVIMETDDAGLEVVKYIREELDNPLMRIILRTGQPGQVPEKSIILNYDINDYKTKTELTTQKLFTTVLTALRSFALGQKLQKEIERREQVEIALRCSEAKEHQKAIALEQSLKELQQAQFQLIQSEKMSSLGQLVAGIAHEINNPVNFIYGNLSHANEYIEQVLELLNLYQQHYPQPAAKILQQIKETDLPFIVEDLPKLFSSMQIGVERIRTIVLSLRNFSRLDETEIKSVDIHEGINSTLMILQHRVKTKLDRSKIEIITEYGALPRVTCYAGQLNQVFMNLLVNAIDALEEKMVKEDSKAFQPMILIHTEAIKSDLPDPKRSNSRIRITISDNGIGMNEQVLSQLFNPFFTTKPIGRGTGMGLSIAWQILVEKHGGTLQCISTPKEGTQFIIEIPVNCTSYSPLIEVMDRNLEKIQTDTNWKAKR